MYWLPFFQAKTEPIPLFISTVPAYFSETVKKGIALLWESSARPKCPLWLSPNLWEVLNVYDWLLLVGGVKGGAGTSCAPSLKSLFCFLWLSVQATSPGVFIVPAHLFCFLSCEVASWWTQCSYNQMTDNVPDLRIWRLAVEDLTR